MSPRVALAVFAVVLLSIPLNAQSVERLLWHDPGDVAKVDLGGSVGTGVSPPKPPFTFIKEDTSGTQPKVLVKDSSGNTWNVKFGYEVKPECFAWRLPAAVGYFVEPSYYVAAGEIIGLGSLERKTSSVQAGGHFREGRFQVRDPNFKYLGGRSWKWAANPFSGTSQLKGLEILIMLASNWDNKDATWGPGNSNTGLFERVFHGQRQLIYSFTDWGSGMGAWGDKTGQTDWACNDYTRQTAVFVKGVVKGDVLFGYEGHHNDDFKTHIRPADVAWLMKYLGQITDAQLRAALRATGATPNEEGCFTQAIRQRVEQLRAVSRDSAFGARSRLKILLGARRPVSPTESLLAGSKAREVAAAELATVRCRTDPK